MKGRAKGKKGSSAEEARICPRGYCAYDKLMAEICSEVSSVSATSAARSLGDPKQDAEQASLFKGIEDYLACFAEPNRKLHAIHNVMLGLRRIANEQQVAIGGMKGGRDEA